MELGWFDRVQRTRVRRDRKRIHGWVMAMPSRRSTRRPRATKLCQHFEDTILVGCERAGLDSLEAEHKAVILSGAAIGCGVSLDQCRKPHEPDAPRWDYVFVRRDGDQGF